MAKYNVWATIPKLTEVDRGDGKEPAAKIQLGGGNNPERATLGMDGGLTLAEVEDLEWRCKQAIQLLKTGKIRKQSA